MAVSTSGASPADGDLSAAREALEARAAAEKRGEEQAAARAAAAKAARPSLLDSIKSLLADLPGLLSDRVHLAALELKRARQALLQMAALVVLAAILAATAWLALWAFIVALLLAAGLPLPAALALILILNALGGWIALRRAAALSDRLTLPATLRHLTLAPAASAAPPPAPAAGAAPTGETTVRGPL